MLEAPAGARRQWAADRALRPAMRSPGRPEPLRAVERAFWRLIAEGLSSEDAAAAVGVSTPVGSRWFRHAGGIVPWALAALDDPSHHLLVHCAMGSNRGPSGAFAILLMLGWTPDDALHVIQSHRPYAQIQYAEDACLWVHSVTAASVAQRSADYAAITRWRTHSRTR